LANSGIELAARQGQEALVVDKHPEIRYVSSRPQRRKTRRIAEKSIEAAPRAPDERLTGAGVSAGTAELLITREWAIVGE
jgi:hypothetical protein